MPNYDFRTLSPIDFEGLARDLIQEELGITLESFKSGKDLGIDFRYCRDQSSTLVVQCKHYVESGYDALLHVLKTKELAKVRLLKPRRYIIATSVPLNPPQKDRIVRALSPYVLTPADILGREDLNNLLGKHPHVERRTLKLWLFSLPVLEQVLHARVTNFSRHELDRIKDHAKMYVQNESFEEAVKILDEHNFCVIAGIPGIGKTILAEMLVLHYSRAGFEVVKVSDDIAEAWALNAPEPKRVFYYDDFLGQTSLEGKLHKNEDQRLIDFVHAVRNSTNVKLILTTREYILQQAYLDYEKLDRGGFDSQKCIIDLEKYTRMNRARILFNHIYFSGLPERYLRCILSDRIYLKIIDHRNYSPRIVQLMTEYARISKVDPARYVESFMANMENPLAIWRHAFETHLSPSARNLLVVLASMPYESFMSDVQMALQGYNLAYAKRFGGTIGQQNLRWAMRELEGDFLAYDQEEDEIVVRFQNPSVRDFVRQFLFTNVEEMSVLASSGTYFEQVRLLWNWTGRGSGREALVHLFKTNRKAGVSLLKRVMSAGPCQITRVSRQGVTRRERWPTSREQRAGLLAAIMGEWRGGALPLLKGALNDIIHGIDRGQADRSGLCYLVEQLASSGMMEEDWAADFTNAAKEYLLTDPSSADDLRPVCDLVDSCPELFSDEDMERVVLVVTEVARSIASGNTDLDSDGLREEAEALDSVSKELNVDVRAQVRAIREKADELDRDGEQSQGEIEYSRDEDWGNCFVSDDDIASLFATLDVRT